MVNDIKEVDLFRDTYVRYFGYANEVGEAFRSIVSRNLVRFSYAIAIGYVVADSTHKAVTVYQDDLTSKQLSHVALSASDTLIWQGFASVLLPGITINRLCHAVHVFQQKVKNQRLKNPWISVAVGLISIPFIIHPIDNFVENGMNATYRQWVGYNPNNPSD